MPTVGGRRLQAAWWEYALFVVVPALAVLFFGIRIVAGLSRAWDVIGFVLDAAILIAGTRYVLSTGSPPAPPDPSTPSAPPAPPSAGDD